MTCEQEHEVREGENGHGMGSLSLNVFGRKRGKTESSVTGVCLVGFTPRGLASGSRQDRRRAAAACMSSSTTRDFHLQAKVARWKTQISPLISPQLSGTLHQLQTHLADVFFLHLSVILLLCLTVHTSDSCNNSGCSPLVPVTWWRLSLYDAPLQGRVGQHAWAVSQSPWSPVTNHTGVQSIRCSPEGRGINVSLLPRALQCTHRSC